MARITGYDYTLCMSCDHYAYYDYDGNSEIILNTFDRKDFRYGVSGGGNVYLRTKGVDLDGANPLINSITFEDDNGKLIVINDVNVNNDGFQDIYDSAFGNPNILMGPDTIIGTVFHDELIGFRGADFLSSSAGNDIIRAGNGPDLITGGAGNDILYGGFGKNKFLGNKDSYTDIIYIKSDQFAYNYLYDKAGNSPNGEKVDYIYDADSSDSIILQGVSTDMLTVSDYLGDIGIFADGYVEAVVVSNSLKIWEVAFMVSGEI